MRTNLKVALRRTGLLNVKDIPFEKLEANASKYWEGNNVKEGRRYNIYLAFRFLVFRDYKEETMNFLRNKDDRGNHTKIMDKISMDATNLVYENINGKSHLDLYRELIKAAAEEKAVKTYVSAANISLTLAEKYISARNKEKNSLGAVMQQNMKQCFS